MDRIAQAASAERAELFRSSAAVLRPERSPAIIEKDFWVRNWKTESTGSRKWARP